MAEFEPENSLEMSLEKATRNAADRPQFLRDLLGSNIFTITAGDPPAQSGPVSLSQGDEISVLTLEKDGVRFLPIFTSLKRLQQVISAQVNYIKLGARDFFELTRGATIILNPGLAYGKEFTLEEISRMLDGSIFRADQRIEVQEETQVLIGQPAVYPHELVNALIGCFKNQEDVKAAYLVQIQYPGEGEQPHPLILIDLVRDYERISAEAGSIARSLTNGPTPVDITRVDQSQFCQDLVRETKPFYIKPI